MLNILDLGFLGLAVAITCTGFVIKRYEKHVPAFIIKSFKYGSFAYKGSGANYLQLIEVPKALYKHFYAFSSILSAVALLYTILIYYFEFTVNKYLILAFKFILEKDKPSVSAGAAVLSLVLLVIQCFRRYYETYYMQVFSKSSKMNLNHYIVGYVHYFGSVVGVIGEAPLFCGDQIRANVMWIDKRTTVLAVPCILIFVWAWYEQLQSNIILANLRKDKKSGEVITEEHKIPRGRLFNYVSSPHRLCEIIIYALILAIMSTKTYFFIFLWVLSNQTFSAVHAHNWYKNTFKDYPSNRQAILPKLI